MKNWVLLFILFGTASFSYASDTPAVGSDRQMLMQLLNERKEKFSAYTGSLDEASGFFGNQTKKDVKKSNEILKDIVRLDNKMISILNRQVDYKNYEKTNLNYEQIDCENKLAESETALKNLMKMKVEMIKKQSDLNKEIWFYKMLSGVFALVIIGLFLRMKLFASKK